MFWLGLGFLLVKLNMFMDFGFMFLEESDNERSQRDSTRFFFLLNPKQNLNVINWHNHNVGNLITRYWERHTNYIYCMLNMKNVFMFLLWMVGFWQSYCQSDMENFLLKFGLSSISYFIGQKILDENLFHGNNSEHLCNSLVHEFTRLKSY